MIPKSHVSISLHKTAAMSSMSSQDPINHDPHSSIATGMRCQAPSPRDFNLIFCDRNEARLSALRAAFTDVPNMSFANQSITDLCDLQWPAAFGSAGNSFGMMGGGVDLAIRDMLSAPGDSMQQRCHTAINEKFFGEQPVGTCMLVPAPKTDVFDWLAYAPTMTVPEDCSRTRNAYLAFRSLLMSVCQHNASAAEPLRSVFTTSLCTGSGCMSSENAAAQMRLAYAAMFEARPVLRWPEIQNLQLKLHANIKCGSVRIC